MTRCANNGSSPFIITSLASERKKVGGIVRLSAVFLRFFVGSLVGPRGSQCCTNQKNLFGARGWGKLVTSFGASVGPRGRLNRGRTAKVAADVTAAVE